MGESRTFKRFGSYFHPVAYPGCEHVPFRSDQYWECLIVNYASSLQHQSGTCKMGPSSDSNAVVNPELQVYGVKGLRVVDASIIPILPASHTNSVVFMIGEKAADLVKNFWKNQEYNRTNSEAFSNNNFHDNLLDYQTNYNDYNNDNQIRRRSNRNYNYRFNKK